MGGFRKHFLEEIMTFYDLQTVQTPSNITDFESNSKENTCALDFDAPTLSANGSDFSENKHNKMKNKFKILVSHKCYRVTYDCSMAEKM